MWYPAGGQRHSWVEARPTDLLLTGMHKEQAPTPAVLLPQIVDDETDPFSSPRRLCNLRALRCAAFDNTGGRQELQGNRPQVGRGLAR